MSSEAGAPIQLAVLIRHGETAWTVTGQHTGRTDLPLTGDGRATARRLAAVVAQMPFALVLTSPLRRARQTCTLAGVGECAELDADLLEWHYGDYEGLTPREIQARDPGWMLFTHGCPGGETPDEVSARVDRVIARIRSIDGDIAVFAHGHLLRVFAARWLGLPTTAASRFLLDPGAVSVLTRHHGIPAVKTWNHRYEQ